MGGKNPLTQTQDFAPRVETLQSHHDVPARFLFETALELRNIDKSSTRQRIQKPFTWIKL
jgi:hypothetical protein